MHGRYIHVGIRTWISPTSLFTLYRVNLPVPLYPFRRARDRLSIYTEMIHPEYLQIYRYTDTVLSTVMVCHFGPQQHLMYRYPLDAAFSSLRWCTVLEYENPSCTVSSSFLHSFICQRHTNYISCFSVLIVRPVITTHPTMSHRPHDLYLITRG